jgi:hypothetical protein
MTAEPTTTSPAGGVPHPPRRSVFAGLDVCEAAGLAVLPGFPRPRFEADVWSMEGLADAPRQMPPYEKTLDFSKIRNPLWRVVAKEFVMAILVPRHESVIVLPHALRTRRSPRTCHQYVRELTAWLNWLIAHGISRLDDVTQDHCDVYLAERLLSKPKPGRPQRSLDPLSVTSAFVAVQSLSLYGELYSTDRYRLGFVPWDGKSAHEVLGVQWNKVNRTQPLTEEHFGRLLAAALYVVEVIGPHAMALLNEVTTAGEVTGYAGGVDAEALLEVIRRHYRDKEPLARATPHAVKMRLDRGWDPHDPLLHVNTDALARQIGCAEITHTGMALVRDAIVEAVADLGLEEPWGRQAGHVSRADGPELVPWTVPLSIKEVYSLSSLVVTAALVVTSAVTGMRSSELMEIVVGSRLPPAEIPGGGRRFRLASKVIKGRVFGGTPDEWVVLPEVDRAIELAENVRQLTKGEPVFGKFDFHGRYKKFRAWVNGPAGQRLGLLPIPDGPVNPRILRRTLALELARRPGGVLAAKVALKHVSVATSEGYASCPGGSQALFMAEVQEAEQEHRIKLTMEVFRSYQEGVMPSGLGARHLIETFSHIDSVLKETERAEPAVMDTERRIENLLRAQAGTLHIGTANYCWFKDPAQALCLRMAGTPDADKPLAGMCDSTRCPQATHHPCHRPVWQDRAAAYQVFLGNPRIPKGEKDRLQPEYERTAKVLDQIATATTSGDAIEEVVA